MSYRLLSIHAHPDDEASKGAATTAMYAHNGHEVMIVTCTGGERGDIINPAMDKPGVKENIQAVRHEEMAESVRALGVQHKWMGYVDSGLPQGDPMPPLPDGCFGREDSMKVATELIEIIREFKPHVIMTYDENGGYPHPDHLKVHEISMIAWERAGDPEFLPEVPAWEPLKLYYSHGFVYQRMEMFHNRLLAQGKSSPYGPMMERWDPHLADIMSRVTTQVECSDYFSHREAALRAHATQIDPAGAFMATDVSTQQELWPTEEYELARSRVATELPETDLFAGLEGTD